MNIKSIILLMILNLIDGIMTYIGLEMRFYEEKNIIMNHIYNIDSNMFIAIKIIIPTLAMLCIIYIALRQKLSPVIKYLINIVNVVYVGIAMYHGYLMISLINGIY